MGFIFFIKPIYGVLKEEKTDFLPFFCKKYVKLIDKKNRSIYNKLYVKS